MPVTDVHYGEESPNLNGALTGRRILCQITCTIWQQNGTGLEFVMSNSNSIAKSGDANRDALSGLLSRLDADDEKAWAEYDLIRRKLLKFFECHRCWPAEEYADEVLDRIAIRSDIREIRDIASFAIGVARNLRLEDRKRTQRMVYIDCIPEGVDGVTDHHDLQNDIIDGMDKETRRQCLKKCLTQFRVRDRDLILDYYSAEGVKDYEHRRALAERMRLKMDALRVRMNRAREKLEQCVQQCLAARSSRVRSENSGVQG